MSNILKYTLQILVAYCFTTSILHAKEYADTLHINQNIRVLLDETFEISAGTVVLFHGYYSITVEGTLLAVGTEDAPILFTASDTLGLHQTEIAEGGWNGIRFINAKNSNSNTSYIDYCIFQYSKASALDYENGGAISIIRNFDVVISNSVFKHNYCYLKGGAIFMNGNNTPITHSYFFNNTALNDEEEDPSLYADGGAIFLKGCQAEIGWSHFEYNYASGIGGAIVVEEAEPLVYNNLINNNYAEMGGGISLRRVNSSNTFSNNVIVNNSSMYFGGGMFFLDSYAVITNQTITNNYSMYGGGLFFITFNNLTEPDFYNSIVRDNMVYPDSTNQVFIWDAVSSPDFYYCNIQGGIEGFDGGGGMDNISFENNIDVDAMFLLEGEHPYSLDPESPCIDAGHPNSHDLEIFHLDIAGNDRFSGLNIDMGAYEFYNPHYTVNLILEGEGYTEPAAGMYFLPEGTEISFTATPADNWIFEHWENSSEIIEDNPITIEIFEDLDIKAVFSPANFIENENFREITFYPNPVSTQLTIEFGDLYIDQNNFISLFNNTGQLIEKAQIQTDNKTIVLPFNFEKLQQGVYYLKIENEQHIKIVKIIKS